MGMVVLPIFYKVDPSDIRIQRNIARAFVKYEIRFKRNLKKVQRWKDALKEVVNISGWHLQNSLKAFGEDHPAIGYQTLSQYFVQYASGLPLAIKVLGSFLFKRSTAEWESALGRLKEYPEREILDVLQISFDGLHQTETEIFLHIACFFNNEDKDLVEEILDCLDLYPKIGLRVLFDKSLVKLQGNKLWMHDLLQEMGRYIVLQECRKEPWKCSRMWLYKDIDNVLTKNMEIEAVEGMVLKLPEPREAHWKSDAFLKMRNLKLLGIHNIHLLHYPQHLPPGLKFLDWSGYASKFLPSDLLPNELVGLRMCCNNNERFWTGTKCFDKLKFIHLNESQNLIETPDLNKVPNLEKLVMEEKSAAFCRRQKVLDTASPELLDMGTQVIKKQKEKPQNRDLVVTSTRESSIVVVLELFCGFLFAPPCRR
ncbi:hypothetical protein SO802_024763 [Lithocarpus litseifolius]|uniref:TIR domain-containing protein n=1 Tax=Lithocarpus litseifolius TaxID=425828 RepID=A0AAW2C9W3_9ROSI